MSEAAPPPAVPTGRARPATLLLGLGVGGAALAAWYLPRMAPGILSMDMAELQYHAWRLGVPHGTGFPVYVWLGHLLTYLPAGEVAWRVTLLSALSSAGTLVFFVLAFVESGVGRGAARWVAAVLAAGTLGWSWTFFHHAVVAEAYSLHLLFASAVLWLALRWGRTRSRGLLLAGAFLWALSWGNHLMTTALGPPLVLYLACHRPAVWRSARLVAAVVGAFLAGLAAVLVLFWLVWRRHLPQSHLEANVATALDVFDVDPEAWKSFWRQWWFVQSGEQFRSLMMTPRLAWKLSQLRLLPWRLLGEFFPVGAALILPGWAWMWRLAWRPNLLLTALAATQMVVIMHYHLWWEIPPYHLPIYLCAAFWIGAGAALVLGGIDRAARAVRGVRPGLRAPLGWALCAATGGALGLANLRGARALAAWSDARPDEQRRALESAGPRPDWSGYREAERRASFILRALRPSGIFVGGFRWQFAAHYLAETRADAREFMAYEMFPFAHRRHLSAHRLAVVEQNVARKRILVEAPPPVFFERFRLGVVGRGLYRVYPRPPPGAAAPPTPAPRRPRRRRRLRPTPRADGSRGSMERS